MPWNKHAESKYGNKRTPPETRGSLGGAEVFTERSARLLTTRSSAEPAAVCVCTLTTRRWCGVGGAGNSIVHSFLSELQTESGQASGQADEDEKPDPRMLTGSELWEMYRIIDPTVRVRVCVCVERNTGASSRQHLGAHGAKAVFSTSGQARGSGREGVSKQSGLAAADVMPQRSTSKPHSSKTPAARFPVFARGFARPWERRWRVGERANGRTERRE